MEICKVKMKKFKYKCIECGKGHNGLVIHIKDGGGYTDASDFCSFGCFQMYHLKHGYVARQKITDKGYSCVICNKKHQKGYINIKNGIITHDFCSPKCYHKAIILVKTKGKKEYKELTLKFLHLFKDLVTIDKIYGTAIPLKADYLDFKKILKE